ncbi:GumC family protein [Gillisia marina]|uniref:GumC family protein n=1 Tax=Gillisia marina TaxID=1167637 RepID=UPI00029AA617|nr:tyrosine-protein kinase family protein [Gillisia marina]
MAYIEKYNNRAGLNKMNLRKELYKYLKHWPLFLFCLLLFGAAGYLYLKYTTPLYSAKATIIINGDSKKGDGSAIFSEMGLINGIGASDIVNEIAIFNSKRLMEDVVKSLNIHIQYFIDGQVQEIEIYENLPFDLQVLKLDNDKLKAKGDTSFEISKDGESYVIIDTENQKTYRVEDGTPVNLGFTTIAFLPNQKTKKVKMPSNIIVKFSNIEKVASHYRGKFNISQLEKSSGFLELELNDPVKEKARDILDQIILEFNRAAIEDKNLIAGNTAKFINERLAIINGELDSVETGKEAFKERNQLTDIQAESQMFIQNASDYNQRRQEVGTQLELSNAMLEYISSISKSELLPTNLGISEGGVNNQINEYNDLVLQRNRILTGSSEKNPVILRLNSQINQIKGNVLQSLKNMRSNLQIAQEDLNRQASSIGSQIYAVPSLEREHRGIERQQNIKETLYLFLLQKREENSLSLAIIEPKAKVVDSAYFSKSAVSPNAKNIYLGTVILALFIPFSIIYIREMLDNKVRGRNDIETYSKEIPILGTIPKITKNNAIVLNNDRSIIAESFRILITNLQYLLAKFKNESQGIVLMVTSSLKGEGKTFTAVNLALTLAQSEKKVLLVGADLRNPQLSSYFGKISNQYGLSDYLVNNNLHLKNIITQSTLNPQLDLLSSGTIPPNPFELLKLDKIGKMFLELKEMYSYIIVDTAPSMMVGDTFLITKYANLVLYIVRAGHTEKESLEFPLDSKQLQKLPNVSFVLNDVKLANLGYGNKYGYGYGETKKKFWSKPKFSSSSSNGTSSKRIFSELQKK